MNKEILKKLEKRLQAIKNSKSDYQTFIENFKYMIKDDKELTEWVKETFK